MMIAAFTENAPVILFCMGGAMLLLGIGIGYLWGHGAGAQAQNKGDEPSKLVRPEDFHER